MIHPLLKLAGLRDIQPEQPGLKILNELLFTDPILFYYPGFGGSDFKPVLYINKIRFPLLTADPEVFIFSECNEYSAEPDFTKYCQTEDAPVNIQSFFSFKIKIYNIAIYHIKIIDKQKWVICFHKVPEVLILKYLITNNLKTEFIFTIFNGLDSFPGEYQYYFFLFNALGVRYQISDFGKLYLVPHIENDECFNNETGQVKLIRENLPASSKKKVSPITKGNALTILNTLSECQTSNKQYPDLRQLFIRNISDSTNLLVYEEEDELIEDFNQNKEKNTDKYEKDTNLVFSSQHLQSLFNNNPFLLDQIIASNPGKPNNIKAIASGEITTDTIVCSSIDDLDKLQIDISEEPITRGLAERLISQLDRMSTSSKNRILTLTGVRRVEDFNLSTAIKLISEIFNDETLITSRFPGLRMAAHLELNETWRELKLLKLKLLSPTESV